MVWVEDDLRQVLEVHVPRQRVRANVHASERHVERRAQLGRGVRELDDFEDLLGNLKIFFFLII